MARTLPRRSAVAVALAGLLALAVAIGVGRFAFTPILPMMQEDAGVSIAMGGWLASANYIGYLLGALSVIGLRIRATRAIRAGLVTIGLATLAMGLEAGFAIWLILRAVAGVASAWVLIHVSAWCLGRLASLRRPALGSTVFAGVGAGIALAGGLCLALMHAQAGSARAWSSTSWPVALRNASATARVWASSRGTAETASAAWSICANVATMVFFATGFGMSRSRTLVITPRVPSEPMNKSLSEYPATSLTHLLPVHSNSPLGNTTSIPMT